MDGSLGGCARCGAPLTGGRFCTSCGAPVDAGGVATQRQTTFGSAGETTTQPAYAAPEYDEPAAGPPQGGPGKELWIGAGALLLAVLLLGSWLLLHGQGASTATSGTASSVGTNGSSPSPSPSSSSPSPSSSPASPSPSTTPTRQIHGPAEDVAGLAHASAPGHSPPAVDLDGRPVTYVPSNMVDGAADTSWRTPGNATNTVLTFRLDQPTTITKVGLINGYAKIAYAGGRRYDWYQGNRRVLVVTWIFDDGTTIGQHLTNTMSMQTMSVRPVTTRTVRLRIDAVTPPGHGLAGRNETAVSEVSLVGRPA